VFQAYASEAIGIKELAHRMRARGIPTRRAPYWSHISVRDILTKSIYTGRIAYNRRRFKLNKRTGRRVPVWRGEAEHLVQQDERLRIVDDAVFQQVQERLSSRASAGGGQLRSEARPFTGLIFCEACGSVCYRRSSKNRKGEYHYYACGRRQRSGLDVCQNTASIREDQLLAKISETLVEVFDDADALIEEAVEEARKMLGKTRDDAQQIRVQLAELDRKVTAMTRLLIDLDIETLAKKAVSRQLGELEAERERLQKILVETSERGGRRRALSRCHQAGDERSPRMLGLYGNESRTAGIRGSVGRAGGLATGRKRGTKNTGHGGKLRGQCEGFGSGGGIRTHDLRVMSTTGRK